MIRQSYYIKLKFFTFCGNMERCNVIIEFGFELQQAGRVLQECQ